MTIGLGLLPVRSTHHVVCTSWFVVHVFAACPIHIVLTLNHFG